MLRSLGTGEREVGVRRRHLSIPCYLYTSIIGIGCNAVNAIYSGSFSYQGPLALATGTLMLNLSLEKLVCVLGPELVRVLDENTLPGAEHFDVRSSLR